MTIRRLAIALCGPLLLIERAHAQAEVALEVAGTRVTYDGFLASNAVTLAPTFSFTSTRASAVGAVVATFFESGSRSSLVSFDGAWRLAAQKQTTLELRGSAGANFYTFSNAGAELLGGLRIRHWRRAVGVWAGGDVGAVGGNGESTVGRLELGAWWRGRRATLRLSALPTTLTGRDFSDITADATWRSGRLELGALGGYRLASAENLNAPFGALAAHLNLRSGVDAGVTWGRSLPDLLRASPGARYAMLSFRVSSSTAPPRIVPRVENIGAAALAIQSVTQRGDTTMVVVRARGADRVELSGDFSDWEPRDFQRISGDRWRATVVLPPGVYRFNVRMNGGDWSVPAGAGRVNDDFGGEVGVLVVQPMSS